MLKQQPFGQRKGEQETTKMQINTRNHLIYLIQTTAVFVTSHLAKMGEKWLLISCVNLRKATISFVTSVCPPVLVHMDGIS